MFMSTHTKMKGIPLRKKQQRKMRMLSEAIYSNHMMSKCLHFTVVVSRDLKI